MMRKAKAVYSECWEGRESAIVTWVWQKLRHAEEWGTSIEETRKGSRCA